MRTGRPVLLKIEIGNQYGDLICIDKEKKNGNYYYLMECMKCHRTKWMKSSTIRLQHGITHKACGKGLKTKCKVFYERWQAMRTRTDNPNYEHYNDYGGRGIKSEEFKYFIDFYDKMYDSFVEKANEIGERNTSLERIDCNKDYCTENCIWIDKHDQPKNQRKTVHFLAIFPNGKIEEWYNCNEFARTYHIDDTSVNDAVNGKIKTYKNIKFKRLP